MSKRILLLLALISSLLVFAACSSENPVSSNENNSQPETNNSTENGDENVGAGADEVEIAGYVFSTSNLALTSFRNGDEILHASTAQDWAEAANNSEPAWCYYNFDSENEEIYGKLYNWHAVNDSRELAPEGWSIPSKDVWDSVISSLGGTFMAGGDLKETGTTNWNEPNTGATNETKFSGRANGFVDAMGFSNEKLNSGYWWSTTEYDENNAYHLSLSSHSIRAGLDDSRKASGMSVRVIKE